jgi:DNA mismatch endonuclease (patch repair protein)
MSRIRAKNTGPELAVRRFLHGRGFRYRLHRRDLPGSPDLVLAKHETVVFVHGCFWHRHPGCRRATTPKSNSEFWQQKFSRTVERDGQAERTLKNAGWNVITAWECEIKEPGRLEIALADLLTLPLKTDGS